MKRKAASLCLLLTALAAAGRAQTPAQNIRLTILHTNDIHGWIMPRPATFYAADPRRPIGGAAALAAYVKKTPGPKLVLDAGDWFQGTPEGGLRDGRVMADVFNAVGYDALEVGNHDFDNGERSLQAIIKAIKSPVLCANVYRAGVRVPECRPWIIKEVAGVKVGIFGLLTTDMKALAFPGNIAGLTFRREVDEAKDAVAALRQRGATVIIAVTHVGVRTPAGPPFEDDQVLAAQVEGIDVIVGGHSHTALPEGLRDAAHGTLIVQTGAELTRVGQTTLEIDPATKKVVGSSSRLVDLWPDETGSDPAAAAVVDKLAAEVKPIYDVVLATAAAPLLRSRDGESALGDWMTDCERRWAGADLAIQNGGGIRVDIPAGPVTFRQIFNVMPFNNRMVKFVMKGRQVRDLLEQGMGKLHAAQTSGAHLSYHPHAAEGKHLQEASIAGKPLQDDASYTVATIDFLALGGDGYTAFSGAQSQDFTKTLLRDVLKACAQKERLIQAPAAGRLVPLAD